MSDIEQYVREVVCHIRAPAEERQRFEADLRAHLEDAVRAGETPGAAIVHMGSPAEVAVEFMARKALPYAGFWPRLPAFAVDMAIIFLAMGVAAVVGLVAANLVPQEPRGVGYVVGAVAILIALGSALGAVGLLLLYFPLLEGRYGQTLGKRLLGLRVLKESGLPIGYKEAFLRWLPYYFHMLPVDALFIFFTAKHQRAFDIVAKTVVVREAQ